ncbi:MAG: CoA-acylating methylmalonate-semialdehyde dehydrogenase [Syntrophobacteraceae bacterium]|nr:CoA-acylating methylmalonate-semialdehyde dehydrogenase [Syntrophobacteraceae bacterium]
MGAAKLRNYIGGEWVEAQTVEYAEVIDPARGKLLARVPLSTSADVERAVKSAAEAFPDWRNTPPAARARYLFRLKELMEDRFDELAEIQTREHGKTIDESRGETRRGIEQVEVASAIPTLMQGCNLEDIAAAGIDEHCFFQPVGVFSHIAPFNFPFMAPLWFVPYAIAAGNTFVVKPSPRVPLSQTRVVELFEEIDLPPGVLNMVHGANEATNAILHHPDVAGVTFVGSTAVGRDIIYKSCGETGKRVIAQCGAKNFIVVLEDCDLEKSMAGLMTSFFGNTGQRCLAGANLVLVGSDSFRQRAVDAFIGAAAAIRVGDGMDGSVQMGPLQNAASKQRVIGYIETGIREGAQLALDGRKLRLSDPDLPQDCFLNPSVFVDVTPQMTIAREEIFGPVACILRAADLDQAIDMIHESPYGNSAAIYTSSGRAAQKFRHDVKCGNIGVNVGVPAPMAFFPFGGMKDSFFGSLHGQGKDAIRSFTDPKVVVERWF